MNPRRDQIWSLLGQQESAPRSRQSRISQGSRPRAGASGRLGAFEVGRVQPPRVVRYSPKRPAGSEMNKIEGSLYSPRLPAVPNHYSRSLQAATKRLSTPEQQQPPNPLSNHHQPKDTSKENSSNRNNNSNYDSVAPLTGGTMSPLNPYGLGIYQRHEGGGNESEKNATRQRTTLQLVSPASYNGPAHQQQPYEGQHQRALGGKTIEQQQQQQQQEEEEEEEEEGGVGAAVLRAETEHIEGESAGMNWALEGAMEGLRSGLGAQGSALEALARRVASAQESSIILKQQLEEVRASLPLVQGANHELNLLRREMREQADGFRADVGVAQRSISAVLDELNRVEKSATLAADGRGAQVGGLEGRVATLEALCRQQTSAAEDASGDSGLRFGAVQSDMAELGQAFAELRADARRLEGSLQGELGARRTAWEALTGQVTALRTTLAASGEDSMRRMAGMLAPVDSKLSASLNEVGRGLQGERAAREAGEGRDREERTAMAELIAEREFR